MTTGTRDRYAGSEWLRDCLAQVKPAMGVSPLGVTVANILGELFYGLYHWDGWKRTDWSNPRYIRVLVNGDLSTHDFNALTRLVFLAHRYQIRVSISPCNMQNLELMFHDRSKPNFHGTHPHPTLTEAVATFEADQP